ncbi:MAG: hypothetical protein KKH41_04730 [Candidatus Thermoplasmatota archaeon]|nr:hypothetical protein [Euryarchaeota archaeon]MBU4032359.1 hypothetical protein [Candidatus Thermoplasmatota archaeon]MBU4071868.1 hypothetical protein [Candidatus Thermoplasmatota archaeon]MBU4144013.1 hypothetical protein [Candidatus Thermoplasmatota archaeon]MBU4591873.1 hypothetical protein [Candidatus Thermoplasmatota archaeon]
MTDLRDKVESDRGIIKMIQLVIPGYRGYRIKEDLRIADRLLREELANRLSIAEKGFEGARKAIAKRNAIDLIEDAGEIITRTHAAIERLRHAEQGYTGISPDYRIQEPELNKMYEWDNGLLTLIQGLMKIANNLKDTARTMPEKDIELELTNALQAIEDYETIFDQRREAIAGLSIG